MSESPSHTQTFTENTQQFEDDDSGDVNNMEDGAFAKLIRIANMPFDHMYLGPNKLKYTIGRKRDKDIRINKPYVSGTHCEIEKNEARNLVTIRDKSSNGTYVNGRNLKGETRILHHNDIVAISMPLMRNNNKNASTPGNQKTQEVDAIQFSILIPESMRPNVTNTGSNAQDILFNTKYKYDETKSIGDGTFGTVHECINKETGEVFAVKVMNLDKLRGYGQDVSILKDEANLMLKIKNHKNIVTLHDAYFSDKFVRLVLDYMDGGDLFDHVISTGVYTESDGKKLINNILQGLSFAHGKNIAHRDLKPENILISSADHTVCKIADWGAAKRATATRKFKTYAGTENYLAPEVYDRKNTIHNVGTYTVKVDMWSVGIIMYIIFAKKFPYQTPQFETENGRPSIKYDIDQFSNLSTECLGLMKAMLDNNADTRITANDALNHEWFGDVH
eukprot:g1116.t1